MLMGRIFAVVIGLAMAMAVVLKAHADDRLAGAWRADLPGGGMHLAEFDAEGGMNLTVTDVDGAEVFHPLVYRADFQADPAAIDIFGFAQGAHQGQALYGILAVVEDGDALMLEYTAGALDADVTRPTTFTERAVTYARVQ